MDKSSRRPLASLMPLIFFFVLCCGILACIFARAADLSVQAGRLNTAVQICRSGAEVFTACGSTADVEAALGGVYFDRSGEPVSEEEAELLLTIQEQDHSGLRRAALTVSTPDGEEIYTLAVSVYLPNVQEDQP